MAMALRRPLSTHGWPGLKRRNEHIRASAVRICASSDEGSREEGTTTGAGKELQQSSEEVGEICCGMLWESIVRLGGVKARKGCRKC